MLTNVEYKVTALSHAHLDKMMPLTNMVGGIREAEIRRAYFSSGSVSYCLLADGKPVVAGGIVNLMWHRGEAWMLTTPFFFKHIRDCYRHIKATIPAMAYEGHFRRIQATCSIKSSITLFKHLGFHYEGILNCFGPNGEDCYMYSRIF